MGRERARLTEKKAVRRGTKGERTVLGIRHAKRKGATKKEMRE